MNRIASQVNVIVFFKGDDKYFFTFDSERKAEVIRTLHRYARNPTLNMTWTEAHGLAMRVRKA